MTEVCVAIFDSKHENEIVNKLKEIGDDFFIIAQGISVSKKNLFEMFTNDKKQRTLVFTETTPEKELLFKNYVKTKLADSKSGIYFCVKEVLMKKYDLIVTIAPMGHVQEIMDEARKMGAGGGTCFSARGAGANLQSFMGMSIDSQKEIILIVSQSENTAQITNAISNKLNFNDSRVGIVFTLPVDNVVFPPQSKNEKEKNKKLDKK
ncbi:MAG: hypothetical protein RR140_02310 [Clostridia bacterium]